MPRAMLFGVVAGMGLLVSPDHLRLWGNLAGGLGPSFWLAALAAAGLYALSAQGYSRLAAIRPSPSGYLASLHGWGGDAAVALALGSRIVLTLSLLTGIHVTAGFVFNETFVYWFPNFAFAFVSLLAVALSHHWGYRTGEKVQAGLLTICLAGMAGLIAAGIWQWRPQPLPEVRFPGALSPGSLCSALLLFVGFDLGIHDSERFGDPQTNAAGMRVALGTTLVLLGLWGTVSLAYVAPGRLADSFIPFTLAARQIGGQTGRILIGIVVIAGTFCASMGLLSAVARMATDLAGQNRLPRFLKGTDSRNLPAVTFSAAAVAALMATGLAGKPELEVLIRAGFLLWLLHIALMHLAVGTARSSTWKATDNRGRRPAPVHTLAALLAIAGTGCLWLADRQRTLLTITMLAAWAGTTALLFAVRRVRTVTTQRTQ